MAGSQRWKGIWADRESAATTTRKANTATVGALKVPEPMSRRSIRPRDAVAIATAVHSARSPIPNAMAVRRTPSRAAGRCQYIPSSRHRATPARVQQIARVIRVAAVIRPAEAAVSRLAPAVNQAARGSPAR